MSEWLLSVPTVFGVESLAAREIRALGYEVGRVEDGRVSFTGDERAICRANIWLRVCERVQIKMGDFAAASFTELFDQVKALPWPSLLPPDAAFPVSGHCLSSKLGSVPDCQSIIKKAVAESMKSRWGLERFSESGALYRIDFNIIRDRATVYVDTSGDGLHKRGYRVSPAPTPIRETLAAALVGLSGWRPGMALWDPFCGSGTIAIEAAMMAANRAPGIDRGFAAEGWPLAVSKAQAENGQHVEPKPQAAACAGGGGLRLKMLFDEERAKAGAALGQRAGEKNRFIDINRIENAKYIGEVKNDDNAKRINNAAQFRTPIEIAGSDLSRRSVLCARENAAAAGVSHLVRFFQMGCGEMDRGHGRLAEAGVKFPERGYIVSNPPYGERGNDREAALAACGEWAGALAGFHDWGWCVISAIEDFERVIGRAASKRRKLRNGKIKCQAYSYYAAGGMSGRKQ